MGVGVGAAARLTPRVIPARPTRVLAPAGVGSYEGIALDGLAAFGPAFTVFIQSQAVLVSTNQCNYPFFRFLY